MGARGAVRISSADLAGGRGLARVVLQRLSPHDQTCDEALERFLSSYNAVYALTQHHDAAVHVGAAEARSAIRAAPVHRRFSYPEAPGVLLEGITYTPRVLAGYFQFLENRARERCQESDPPSCVRVEDRSYSLREERASVPLVGLDAVGERLDAYARQLLLYDPETMSNPDHGRFPRTVLLSGPPGTGKSSLLANLLASCARSAALTGTPLRSEQYDGSSFSSYFGRSTRILKQKLQRIADPSGVGVLCIEDVDMVLQSRSDTAVFHGVLELQQYLFNHLSGLERWLGNTFTVVTTNRVDSLDDALVNRMQAHFVVNPWVELRTHEQYLAAEFPSLPDTERKALAVLSQQRGFSGRDLAAIATRARELTTRPPSDEELRTRNASDHASRYGAVTAAILNPLFAERLSRSKP